jgi:hypothetical protein
LDAYRAQANRYPRGLSGDLDELQLVSRAFEQALSQAQQNQEVEDLAAESLSAKARQQLKTKANMLVLDMQDNILKAQQIAQKTARTTARRAEKSVARQVEDFLKGLRAQRP